MYEKAELTLFINGLSEADFLELPEGSLEDLTVDFINNVFDEENGSASVSDIAITYFDINQGQAADRALEEDDDIGLVVVLRFSGEFMDDATSEAIVFQDVLYDAFDSNMSDFLNVMSGVLSTSITDVYFVKETPTTAPTNVPSVNLSDVPTHIPSFVGLSSNGTPSPTVAETDFGAGTVAGVAAAAGSAVSMLLFKLETNIIF